MNTLNIIRRINNHVGCSITGKAIIERKFKDRAVYNYLEVPESCFKKKSTSNVLVMY